MNSAQFRFYEELNDFLPIEKRKQDFVFNFQGNPAVKDAIEAYRGSACRSRFDFSQ